MIFREFKRKHGSRLRVWRIAVEGDRIITKYGYSGGTIRKTEDVPGPSARETAEERAISRAEKLIKDKLNTGYTEYDLYTDVPVGKEAETEVNFDGAPPDGLEVFKPKVMPKEGDKEHKKMMDAINRGDEIITKKYDGMKHLVMVDSKSGVRLFTRRMEECTFHYPQIINELHRLRFPNKTILAVELYVPRDKFTEDFLSMQSLSRSLPERAVEIQKLSLALPKAVILSPVFWGGEPIIKTEKVIDWLTLVDRHIYKNRRHRKKIRRCVHTMQTFSGGLEDAMNKVKLYGFEGLVVYDSEACFGEKAFNFRGKSERPECWKQKFIYEDDFVAIFDPHRKKGLEIVGSFGSGKNMNKPKSLALYQYNKLNQLTYVCNVGTGLDDKTRDMIAKAAKEDGWARVVAVEYTKRKYISKGDISNALTFPSFKKIHEDKLMEECVDENL